MCINCDQACCRFSCVSVENKCRPLAFILSLPFAFLSSLLSAIGAIIWIFGVMLSCICPCCLCVTGLLDLALGLIKAPVCVMEWFTKQIPC